MNALPEDIPTEMAQTKATAIYLLLEAALVESRVHHSLWPFEASKATVIQLLS